MSRTALAGARTVASVGDGTRDEASIEVPELRTERLLLRDWRGSDLAPFAELNSDPIAMEHFPSTMTRAQSDEMVEAQRARWRDDAMSWWAVEDAATGQFLGAVGPMLVTIDAPFNDPMAPSVELGWRLRRESWGRGHATEAALAALVWVFEDPGLDEVVSFTVVANSRSRRVMEKLGMVHDPVGDFDHPRVPDSSPLRRHALYRVSRAAWSEESAV